VKNSSHQEEKSYLGLKPPALTPEVFAPGVVSIEEGKEYKITFSPDLKEMFFTRRTPKGRNDRIWYCRFENGKLTKPVPAPFAYDCTEMEAHFTPDGNKVFINSFRPLPGEESPGRRPKLWFVDRTAEGWSEPKVLESELNDMMPMYLSFENNGTVYFTNARPREIRTATYKDGTFTNIKRLPDEVNYLREVAHPAVAPDGSFLLVDSVYLVGDRIVGSLYVSFRQDDGSWTKAVSMKDVLKATDQDIYAAPRVTPDGKYIFFERYERETDKADLYWVSSKVIEKLRSAHVTKFTNLSGPYLDQKPPGTTPELFAPGIITTDISEGCSGWGNEMEYFVFQRWIEGKSKLYIMHQVDGVWSEPESLSFCDEYKVGDFTIAPDGKTMVFASNIPIKDIGAEGEGGNIWFVEKQKIGWGTPRYFRSPVNTKYHDSYPCLDAEYNLYFFSRRPGGFGQSDLYVSKFSDGEFLAPVNLGDTLNTEYHEWDTYVAPDASYMIYCSMMPGGLGEDDLYVTFKTPDGSWSEPVHLGSGINTEKSENRPYVSPDGKYFFYTSTVRGNRDIFWVSAQIIEDLKPR
jgi:Tol biopolymer transport system component